LVGWLLAMSGTFLWLVALSAGSTMVYYGGMCASLIRLRKLRPNGDALRVPFAPILSVVGLAFCLALLTGLTRREVLLMGITSFIAATNWLWAKCRHVQSESSVHAQA
jgi:L-asparagine transporter-like permease